MPFNDNTTKTQTDYETDLDLALQLSKQSQIKTIIMGDMNIDPTRDRQFDKRMIRRIDTDGFKVLHPINLNELRFTFSSQIGRSWIDHVLVSKVITDNMEMEILDDR